MHQPTPGQADLRGFEWYHLWRLGVAELATFADSTGPANAVAFSPDGKLLASASVGGTGVLRDLTSGQVRARLWGAAGPLVFSPDGKTLAGGNRVIGGLPGGGIKLWSSATGRELAAPPGDGFVAISPDGKTLATGGGGTRDEGLDRTIRLWDVKTGREQGRMDNAGSPYALAFSPDGKMLASAGSVTQLWDVATRTASAELPDARAVFSVAFSPDSRLLAGGTYQKTIVLWDTARKKTRAVLKGHPREIYSVAFAPDGRTLASGDFDGNVKLWDVAAEREITTLRGHTREVHSVAFSPDGRMLASASQDQSVKLWEIGTLRNQRVKLWEGTRRDPRLQPLGLRRVGVPIEHLAFSPDGKHLAGGYWEGGAEVYDPAHLEKPAYFDVPDHWVKWVAFPLDSASIVAGSDPQRGGEAIVTQWSVDTGEERDDLRDLMAAQQFLIRAFSADGRMLLATGTARDGENTCVVWNLATNREQVRFTPSYQRPAAAASARDGRDRRPVSAAFSADGRLIALGFGDRTVEVWDTQAGELRTTLRGFQHVVGALAFSPDGRRLASGGGDLTGKSRGELR
jgi:WD40 repeat protein